MPTVLKVLDAGARFCNRIARFLLVILSIVMAAVVFVHLGSRYLVELPLPWLEELARYLMIWIAMMGAPVALAEGRHFGVAYLMDGLSQRARTALMTIAILVILWFLYLLVREGIHLALANWSHRSLAMMIPMFFPYMAIPLGGGMMIMIVLRGLAHVLIGDRRGKDIEGSGGC